MAEVFATTAEGDSKEEVLEPEKTQDAAPEAEASESEGGEEQKDAQADLAEKVATLERELQRERSRNGQRNTRVANERLDRLEETLNRFTREYRRNQIKQDEQDEDRQRQRLREIDDEERQDTEQLQVRKYTDRIADRMNRLITRADIPPDHPAVTEALNRWKSVKTIDDADDVYDYLDEAIEKEAQKPKADPEQEKPRQERSPASRVAMGTTPSSPGGPPRATPDNVSKLWNQWHTEHPERPNPYDADMREFMKTGRIAR